MADDQFEGAVAAFGMQTAFNVPNTTIAGLTGTKDETDGFVLGDKDSGDADSGIGLPTYDSISRAVPAVPSSFTEKQDSFQRAEVNGFSLAFPLQGNGATATPAAGEADFETLHPGIESILEMAGLIGANGTAPAVNYTPRHAGSTGGFGMDGSTAYGTAKLFHGPLELVYSDCLIETLDLVFTPGGNCIVTANVLVGTWDHTDTVDVGAFPTITYGSQEDMAAPVVEGVNFTWGEVRGFENLQISIQNVIEKFGDSNVDVTGQRQAQTGRKVVCSGTLYVAAADSDFALSNLIDTSAITTNLSLQLGTPAGATDTINAFLITCKLLQAKSIKYNRIGDVFAVELGDSKATGTTVGGEFELRAN